MNKRLFITPLFNQVDEMYPVDARIDAEIDDDAELIIITPPPNIGEGVNPKDGRPPIRQMKKFRQMSLKIGRPKPNTRWVMPNIAHHPSR